MNALLSAIPPSQVWAETSYFIGAVSGFSRLQPKATGEFLPFMEEIFNFIYFFGRVIMAINVNVVSIVQAQQQILQDHEKSLQDHEKSLQDTQKCLQDQGKCSKDQSMRIQNKDQRTQDLADEVFNLKRNVEGKDRFEMEIRLNELKDRLNFIQLKLGEYSNTKTEQTVAGIRRAVTGSLGGLVGGVAVAAAGIAAFAISGPAVPIVVCSGLTSSFSGAVYGFISKFNIAADREQRYKLLQMRDGRLRDMMLVKYEIQSIERHLNKKMK